MVVPITLVVLAIFASIIIFLVDLAVPFISPELEHRVLGPVAERVWDELNTDGSDPSADEALKDLFVRVLAQGPEVPIELEARVICMEVPNAFALPGGGIAVTSGLLHTLEREDELAFILGHEIGHFVNRDHIRGLGRGIIVNIMMSVAFSAGHIDGDRVSAGLIQSILAGHGREQEMAADTVGARSAMALYGHVQGGALSMKRLSEAADETTVDAFDFTRSHPVGEVRTQSMTELALAHDWPRTGVSPPLDQRLRDACK